MTQGRAHGCLDHLDDETLGQYPWEHLMTRRLTLTLLVTLCVACTESPTLPPGPSTCESFTTTTCQCLDGTTGVLTCEFVSPQDAPQCLCDAPPSTEDVSQDLGVDSIEDTTPPQDTVAVEDTEVGPQDAPLPQDTSTSPPDTQDTHSSAPDTTQDVPFSDAEAADTPSTPDVSTCVPSCQAKSCGDDGCGGSCGACPAGQACGGGQCGCTPDCAGKTCGDDGCGGSCGSCDDANPCTIDACDEAQTCTHTEAALQPCASPPCAVNGACLYDLDRDALSQEERVTALALQGVLGQQRSAIWIGKGQQDPKYQAQLNTHYGVTFVNVADLWDLVERFSESLNGYLLYNPNTSSQSVGLSLAGVLNGLPVSPALEAAAQSAGLPLLQDVRGKDELWCWEMYGDLFNDHMLTEQWETVGHAEYLVDYPISEGAFIYHDETCGDLRTTLAAQLDAPYIFGWGAECGEYDFVVGASEGGASVIASDFSQNLSVLSRVEGVSTTGNQHAPATLETEDDVHYVAFLMSDGDNIQFIQNAFDHTRWWGSPHRGTFPMTWEMSSVLATAAPTMLRWVYDSASPLDQMVSAPSGDGYFLPSKHPNTLALAERTASVMADTDMRVAVVLDAEGDLSSCDAFTAQPGIDGVVYKDWADYNMRQGELRWSNGKPIFAIRHLLWNNGATQDSPSGIAAAVNTAPKAPKADIASYSIVNIHAWSEWPDNPHGTGATAAAKWTIEQFADHVRVVNVEELLMHLTQNLEGASLPGPDIVYEAETNLAHAVGYADGDGWAVNVVDSEPGHMCYGPYTSAFPAGSYIADFVIMIDVNDPPASDIQVLSLDVFDAASQTAVGELTVSRYDFDAPMTYQVFSVPFTVGDGTTLEFRTFWHGGAYINVDKVHVYPTE